MGGLLGLAVTMLVTIASMTVTAASAATAGSWALTGSMTAARDEATATLLPNGEVLAAGGDGTTKVLSSTELYNPATGTWKATGSMTTTRSQATATLLANGEVLVAGGYNNAGSPLASAELYNPATGTWKATGSMTTPRNLATATLLTSGEVLVAGGENLTSGALASAELYNPATGTWAATGSMTAAREQATATLLSNGTVLEAGGSNSAVTALASAEIYNPATQQWQATPNMANGHWSATASLLPSGQVLVAGGIIFYSNGSGGYVMSSVASADLYNPATGTWSPAASMTTGRSAAAAVVLGNGTVLESGGYSPIASNSQVQSSAEIYNPAANTWTATGSMVVARAMQTATLLPNGTVLAAGGQGPPGVVASAEIYSPSGSSPSPPTVTGITPASGPAAGGTGVTITGTNLTGGSVSFGTAAATGVTCATGSCTATSPAGTGTVNVTVTTTGGTSATGSADQFTYQAAGSSSNLIPDPGFETSGVPSDNWGSTLARSSAVVHSGSWSLAQATTSTSGGWDLDSNPAWYAPITSATTYTASVWVYTTKTVKVDLNVDLLNTAGNYVNSANGPAVTLIAGSWTQLTITGIKPATGEVYAGLEPNFSNATAGTIIYWDDMSLTTP